MAENSVEAELGHVGQGAEYEETRDGDSQIRRSIKVCGRNRS